MGLLPGRYRGRALLTALCCAACTPGGGGARDGSDETKLGEEQAIARAAEMLESRPPAPAASGSRATPAPAKPR